MGQIDKIKKTRSAYWVGEVHKGQGVGGGLHRWVLREVIKIVEDDEALTNSINGVTESVGAGIFNACLGVIEKFDCKELHYYLMSL